jgi:hypothetical protein
MDMEYKEILEAVDKLPLSKSLQKIIRIAQEIKDQDLEIWARLELHGYCNSNPVLSDEIVVPEYRTVAGYYTDDYGRRLEITEKEMGFLNEMRLRFGVVELEGLIGAKGPLAFPAMNFAKIIRENLDVEVTTFNFNPATIPAVLEAIRTHLFDLLISRKHKFMDRKVSSMAFESEEIIQLKPNFYGVGIDLKALWKKFQK